MLLDILMQLLMHGPLAVDSQIAVAGTALAIALAAQRVANPCNLCLQGVLRVGSFLSQSPGEAA